MIKLTVNPDNPRTIDKKDFEKLKKSVQSFTKMLEIRPIAYDENKVIWGGNQRYVALEMLVNEGLVEAKDEYFKEMVGYTLEEKKEFAIRDNVEFGRHDWDILMGNETWADAPLDEWGLDPTEWTTKEVIEDDAPEVSDEPSVSKRGEIYQLGKHRVMCGDSTKIEDVERLMDGNKADMVFTDPPYNIASDSKNFAADVSRSMDKLSKSEWDKGFNPDEFLNLLPVFLKDNSTIYVFTSHFLFSQIFEQLKAWNDFVLYCIWHKPNPMPSLSKRHWTWNTELCLYAVRGRHTFNFPDGQNALSGWIINKNSDGTHPTQKPIELCANPISKSSNQGDIVLDLFLGSGSTLIACEQTNRICYGMELDEKYVDVIRKRYHKFVTGNEEGWEQATPKID